CHFCVVFFFSSRRRHTRFSRDWSSDVCSSDLEVTYRNLGVDFDSYYYESDTYLLGKEFVSEGLKSGVFFKKDDGSVWCDLTPDRSEERRVGKECRSGWSPA